VVALFARPEHRALILDGLGAARSPTEPAQAADPT
jgi:hypothetical protein